MAAPPSITTQDLSGSWVMNKTLSDNTDEILRLQGIGWLTRNAIALATITLGVRHYKDDNNVEHIEIEPKIIGGIPGKLETYTLDWTLREDNEGLFGPMLGKIRRVQLDEIDNEFLRDGWLPDTMEHGAINLSVESNTPKSNRTWIAHQTWGFEEINGERRHVRRIHFIGPEDEHIQARVVYDLTS